VATKSHAYLDDCCIAIGGLEDGASVVHNDTREAETM